MSAQEVAAEVTRREVLKIQQAELQQKVAKLEGDPAEKAAAEVQAVQRRAIETTHALAERAAELDGEYLKVLDTAKSVRADASAGRVGVEEAVETLRKTKSRLVGLAKEREAIRRAYGLAQQILADPEAERNRLRNKYPALR